MVTLFLYVCVYNPAVVCCVCVVTEVWADQFISAPGNWTHHGLWGHDSHNHTHTLSQFQRGSLSKQLVVVYKKTLTLDLPQPLNLSGYVGEGCNDSLFQQWQWRMGEVRRQTHTSDFLEVGQTSVHIPEQRSGVQTMVCVPLVDPGVPVTLCHFSPDFDCLLLCCLFILGVWLSNRKKGAWHSLTWPIRAG